MSIFTRYVFHILALVNVSLNSQFPKFLLVFPFFNIFSLYGNFHALFLLFAICFFFFKKKIFSQKISIFQIYFSYMSFIISIPVINCDLSVPVGTEKIKIFAFFSGSRRENMSKCKGGWNKKEDTLFYILLIEFWKIFFYFSVGFFSIFSFSLFLRSFNLGLMGPGLHNFAALKNKKKHIFSKKYVLYFFFFWKNLSAAKLRPVEVQAKKKGERRDAERQGVSMSASLTLSRVLTSNGCNSARKLDKEKVLYGKFISIQFPIWCTKKFGRKCEKKFPS